MSIEPAVYSQINSAVNAAVDERSAFIRRTYSHLAGAILLFVLLEYALLQSSMAPKLVGMMTGSSFSWILLIGLFMAVGFIADRWARSDTSPTLQYVGLALYVAAEAIIFLPLLYIATYVMKDPSLIPSAGLLTLTLFAGLTGTAFITRKDFSFMRGALMVGSFVAMGMVVASALFGFSLGILFSAAMVGLSGGYILYYTSNIMRDYRTDQHVAASLALFAAIALMFYYVLRIFMSMRD